MVAAINGLEAEVCYKRVSCCPRYYPCPDCGKRGRRKQCLQRQIRTIAYGKIVYLDTKLNEKAKKGKQRRSA